jgi:hypothetical protein
VADDARRLREDVRVDAQVVGGPGLDDRRTRERGVRDGLA